MSHDDLDQDQQALLMTLADVQQGIPKAKRNDFYFLRTFGNSGRVQHVALPGGQLPAFPVDIEMLLESGLIRKTRVFDGGLGFFVSPEGIARARNLRTRQAEPVARLEEEVMTWLQADAFVRRYPDAHGRWTAAEKLLRVDLTPDHATSIGHLCREALQLFTSCLVDRYQPIGASTNPSSTVARLKAVLDAQQLASRTTRLFVDALINYWGCLVDLTQRQEHGAAREGEGLTREDARRVVFYTCLVMFEVDRCLAPSANQ